MTRRTPARIRRKRLLAGTFLLAYLLILAAIISPLARAHPRPFPKWWLKGALCIHSHEGSWRDTRAPHWGGLQMDRSFQKTYGPEFYKRKGTANNWTPHEQLHAARRAYVGFGGHRGRGFYPWPNTARYCGLI